MNIHLFPEFQDKAHKVAEDLAKDSRLAPYLETGLPIPAPYVGTGPIRLVILGQDPTVRDSDRRRHVKTALNMDRRGSLLTYLGRVCKGLGLDLRKHVYATNLLKNFFVKPPTEIHEVPIFDLVAPAWLQFLRDELAAFPSVPVISLGEPLLQIVASRPEIARVRTYWGYTPRWQSTRHRPTFAYLAPVDNRLGRVIFPFPHQPSLRKPYYREHMDSYLRFAWRTAFESAETPRR